MRRTLEAAVSDILEAIPTHIRPERYDLIAAMKLDRRGRWPDAKLARELAKGHTSEGYTLPRATWDAWDNTRKVLLAAIAHGDW